MAVRSLDHINIATARLDETRAFFRDVLGLTEGERPPFPFPGAWMYAGDKDVVHLVAVEDQRTGTREACLNHIALSIDDWQGTIARLREHGVAYREVGVPGRPTRQLFISDPNGVTIELNHRDPAAEA